MIRRGDIIVFPAPPAGRSRLGVMPVRLIPGDLLDASVQTDGRSPRVPENHYWVQREGAVDSRHFGFLSASDIDGVVIGLLHGGPLLPIGL